MRPRPRPGAARGPLAARGLLRNAPRGHVPGGAARGADALALPDRADAVGPHLIDALLRHRYTTHTRELTHLMWVALSSSPGAVLTLTPQVSALLLLDEPAPEPHPGAPGEASGDRAPAEIGGAREPGEASGDRAPAEIGGAREPGEASGDREPATERAPGPAAPAPKRASGPTASATKRVLGPVKIGRAEILAALTAAGGSVTEAARRLGLTTRHVLHRLMRRHGIVVSRGKPTGA